VACWGALHLKACRDVPLTAVRITRAGAAGTKRDPHEAWFWWLGGPLPPLATPPALYARRCGIEHGDKFDQQSLLWGRPRVRAPAQFARWTDLVAAAHHHLALARPLVAVTHRPWERAARTPTPAQVRRALPRILAFTQSR